MERMAEHDEEPFSGLAHLRQQYESRPLNEEDVLPDPFEQFAEWFQQALETEGVDANAMALATASADGEPAVRMVLLKGADRSGFTFFSNYESAKGRNLLENPRAALLFYWPRHHRQIRITGPVARLSAEESAAYFHSRPRGSQIGAIASRQSQVLPHRRALEERVAALERQYGEGDEIPLPGYWGGFRLTPERFEFWQGRPNRLHDRLRYRPAADDAWIIERLSP